MLLWLNVVLKLLFISDKIKPSDVGLEQEAQLVRGWTGSAIEQNGGPQSLPPIKYIHLHECESFTVSVSCEIYLFFALGVGLWGVWGEGSCCFGG